MHRVISINLHYLTDFRIKLINSKWLQRVISIKSLDPPARTHPSSNSSRLSPPLVSACTPLRRRFFPGRSRSIFTHAATASSTQIRPALARSALRSSRVHLLCGDWRPGRGAAPLWCWRTAEIERWGEEREEGLNRVEGGGRRESGGDKGGGLCVVWLFFSISAELNYSGGCGRECAIFSGSGHA